MKKVLISLFIGVVLIAQPVFVQPMEAAKSKKATVQQVEESVMFNTHSYKYHKPGCTWAIRCTRNCIQVPKKEAIQRGGIPCKVCGG